MSFVTPIKIEYRKCSPEDPEIKRHLEELSYVPLYLQNILAEQGARIIFFKGPLTDNPEITDEGKEWDELPGSYQNKKTFIRLDHNNQISIINKRSLIIHETGHSIDELVGPYVSSEGYNSQGGFSKRLSCNNKFHKIFIHKRKYQELSDKLQDELRRQYFAQKSEEHFLTKKLMGQIKLLYDSPETWLFFITFMNQAKRRYEASRRNNNI